MSTIFAFQVAEPIVAEPIQASVRYDEDAQVSVWSSDGDAALRTQWCTGYPAGRYLSCRTYSSICAPSNPNPGAGYGYRCDG